MIDKEMATEEKQILALKRWKIVGSYKEAYLLEDISKECKIARLVMGRIDPSDKTRLYLLYSGETRKPQHNCPSWSYDLPDNYEGWLRDYKQLIIFVCWKIRFRIMVKKFDKFATKYIRQKEEEANKPKSFWDRLFKR